MIKTVANSFFLPVFTAFILLTAWLPTGQAAEQVDIYSGYYSRDGNDDRPAKLAGNSIYIKFYQDKRVILLYVPYPYSLTVKPGTLHSTFKEAALQGTGKAYIRSKFSALAEPAVAHIESYEMLEQDFARFECDGTAPCRVNFHGDRMEMRKAGMLNDHIIQFYRVAE